MREPEARKAKRVWGRKRNGVCPPFRFRRGLSGRQAFVFLGFASKRNETAVFRGVTGKASRLAPPNTVTNRKDPFNINGLRGEAFWAETVFSENRSPFSLFQTARLHARTSRLTTHIPTRRQKCLELFFIDAIFFRAPDHRHARGRSPAASTGAG